MAKQKPANVLSYIYRDTKLQAFLQRVNPLKLCILTSLCSCICLAWPRAILNKYIVTFNGSCIFLALEDQ